MECDWSSDVCSSDLDSLEVLALESDAASHFSKLRNWSELNGFRLTASDLLIAAHAMAKDAILVSPEEGLTQVPGLKLQNWLT
jgi:tRNA(fMet)-specific endonuclease VapC